MSGGYGWLWIPKLVKLSGFIWEHETLKVLKNSLNPYPPLTANVRSVIRINWPVTQLSSPKPDTDRLKKASVKPIILKDLIILFGKDYHV